MIIGRCVDFVCTRTDVSSLGGCCTVGESLYHCWMDASVLIDFNGKCEPMGRQS